MPKVKSPWTKTNERKMYSRLMKDAKKYIKYRVKQYSKIRKRKKR